MNRVRRGGWASGHERCGGARRRGWWTWRRLASGRVAREGRGGLARPDAPRPAGTGLALLAVGMRGGDDGAAGGGVTAIGGSSRREFRSCGYRKRGCRVILAG